MRPACAENGCAACTHNVDEASLLKFSQVFSSQSYVSEKNNIEPTSQRVVTPRMAQEREGNMVIEFVPEHFTVFLWNKICIPIGVT